MPLQNVRSQYAIPAIKFHFPLAASMCPYCTCVRAARIFVVTVIGNEERWTSYILCLVRFSGWRSRGFADSPGKVRRHTHHLSQDAMACPQLLQKKRYGSIDQVYGFDKGKQWNSESIVAGFLLLC
eukprot:c20557_g3_i4 orf=233-610(+)